MARAHNHDTTSRVLPNKVQGAWLTPAFRDETSNREWRPEIFEPTSTARATSIGA
jgi:hypothetical protein